jgi:hypothetical protein
MGHGFFEVIDISIELFVFFFTFVMRNQFNWYRCAPWQEKYQPKSRFRHCINVLLTHFERTADNLLALEQFIDRCFRLSPFGR